jgi:hypothetical protein
MFQTIGENTKQTIYKSIWNWQGYVTIGEVLKIMSSYMVNCHKLSIILR